MSRTQVDTVVVGAGVVGLTTAVALTESGFSVRLISRDEPLQTTSANSGAIWGPFLSLHDARVHRWSYRTLDVLVSMAGAESGVDVLEGLGVEPASATGRWWVEDYKDCRPCSPDDLPDGYGRGWLYRAPIIDVPVYLSYLVGRLRGQGVVIEYGTVTSLDDLASTAHHVVVCAGMGSGALVGDDSMLPAKGQLVVVENPGIERFLSERGDGPELTYVLPQGNKVVLGGTAEWGSSDVRSDDEVTNAILARCARVEPRLRTASVIETRVGVRPCRDLVRVSHGDAGHVVYNYGHGGSGISIAWGCAHDVVDIVKICIRAASA